jgi:hypothetical protein
VFGSTLKANPADKRIPAEAVPIILKFFINDKPSLLLPSQDSSAARQANLVSVRSHAYRRASTK